ncbi:hypothetical protein Q604_UNBC18022G0001, partial [human gut metagenome]
NTAGGQCAICWLVYFRCDDSPFDQTIAAILCRIVNRVDDDHLHPANILVHSTATRANVKNNLPDNFLYYPAKALNMSYLITPLRRS